MTDIKKKYIYVFIKNRPCSMDFHILIKFPLVICQIVYHQYDLMLCQLRLLRGLGMNISPTGNVWVFGNINGGQ